MDTLSPSHVASFIGVLLTEKPFRVLSKKRSKESVTAAKVVEFWLNDPQNKLTILSQLCELARNGTAIGMATETGSLSPVTNSEFYVNHVTKQRLQEKTKGDDYGRTSPKNGVHRTRPKAHDGV